MCYASANSTTRVERESIYKNYLDYMKYHKLTIEYRDKTRAHKKTTVTGEILSIENETMKFRENNGSIKEIDIRKITRIKNSEQRDFGKILLGFLAGASISLIIMVMISLGQTS